MDEGEEDQEEDNDDNNAGKRTPPQRQGAVSSYDFLKKKYQLAHQHQ